MSEIDAQIDAAERNAPMSGMSRYKWMVSILMPSHMRGMYVKPLEKLTPDPKVPFLRLLVGAGIAVAASLFTLYTLMSDLTRASYIAGGMILMTLGIVMIASIYLFGSRGKSMLQSVFDLNLFKLGEKARHRSGMRVRSLGLKSMDEFGTLTFDDGDVGVAYAVRGQLSESTLPSVADAINALRAEYYVGRSASSQEIRITSVEPNTMETQIANLEELINRYSLTETNPASQWRISMAQLQLEYLRRLLKAGNQLTMQQTVIVRETSIDELNRATRGYEGVAHGGLYERSRRIYSQEELESRLGGLAMQSTVKE